MSGRCRVALAAAAAAALLCGCRSYELGPEVRLPAESAARVSVIEVLEHLPLNNPYPHHYVICRSAATSSLFGTQQGPIPRNAVLVAKVDVRPWRRDGGPGPLRDAEIEAAKALASGQGWIAWKRGAFRITFDECATWRQFAPWDAIPSAQVSGCDSSSCARGKMIEDLEYADLRVTPGGSGSSISFVVRSKALEGDWKVASSDGGASWRLTDPAQRDMAPASDPTRSAGVELSTKRAAGSSVDFEVVCRTAEGKVHSVERMSNVPWLTQRKEDQEQAAQQVVRQFTSSGPGWVAFHWRDLRISMDRCGSWRAFEAWKELAPDVACSGTSCAYHELYMRDAIAYENIRVDGAASRPRIRFIVRSKAFRDGDTREVTSVDGGLSWSAAKVDLGPREVPEERVKRRELAAAEGMSFALVQVTPMPRPGYKTFTQQIVVCRTKATRASREEIERGAPRDAVIVGELKYSGWGAPPPDGPASLDWWEKRARDALMTGPGWIAFGQDSLRISRDECRSWIVFEPWKHVAPEEVYLNHLNPNRCNGPGCVESNFRYNGYAEYGPLTVGPDERIEFDMKFPQNAGPFTRHVASGDGGKTWLLTPR